jgi:hypothetical protein
MLSSGIFPRLKFSEIKPIFKKGDKSNIPNYRPISMLTSLSNIFAKVILNRLCHHVSHNNILVHEQLWIYERVVYGFSLLRVNT